MTEPKHVTAGDQYADLVRALASDAQLTELIPDAHTEPSFRAFLSNVLRKMDALRPWPEPPFRPMPVSEWKNFAEARPIARVDLSWVRVQERVHQTFYVPEGTDLEVLLLRMASGAEVAFVAPGPKSRNVDEIGRAHV